MVSQKTLYCIKGWAKFDNVPTEICEFTAAYSPAQAFLIIKQRLEKERKMKVYLGDCNVWKVKTLPPETLKEKQLELNFY